MVKKEKKNHIEENNPFHQTQLYASATSPCVEGVALADNVDDNEK